MRGGARPGAGRKRTKALTLTEIGVEISQAYYRRFGYCLPCVVRGRYLRLGMLHNGVTKTKAEALAYLKGLNG